jgi:tight adherence protein B
LWIGALLGALCATVSAASAVAAGPPTLVEAGNAGFPHRAFILTLPQRASIGTGSVRVTENGEPVIHLSVAPAGSAAHAVGTVLVIDTSNSMAGKPIESAMLAARTFAGRRNRNQEIALITFNHSTNIALPFTSDSGVIAKALVRTPRLAEGTHIYDAVDEALGLIQRAGLRSGTVVLLSDGADVGSRKTFADVKKELDAEHARLFAVGLRSGAFDPSTLQQLAGAGKGSLSVASADNLTRIYDNLGFRLANEYLVEYDSQATPDTVVDVRAAVRGFPGVAAAGYRSPPLQLTVRPPLERSAVDTVLQSWVTMIVVAFLIAALFAVAVRIVVRPQVASVQRRLAEFVSVSREDERRRREEVKAALRREQGAAEQLAVWRRFVEDCELADVKTSPARLLLLACVGAIICGVVGVALVGGLGLLLALAPFFGVRGFVSRKLKKKRAEFGEQLADNLEVLASALRAGHSLVGALSVVVEDSSEPSKSEFQRVLADEQLGVPLENALGLTVKRMANRDLDQVAVVAVLQRDAGANSAEVLDQIVDNIRSRQEIRRLVRVLTAQGRMARWIVSLLPVVLLLIITALNSSYMHPMWHEFIGHVFLTLAAVMVVVGSAIIGRIVDIEV